MTFINAVLQSQIFITLWFLLLIGTIPVLVWLVKGLSADERKDFWKPWKDHLYTK